MSENATVAKVMKRFPKAGRESVIPVLLAVAAGATFVARSFSGDIDHLTATIKAAINHEGFSLVDILQPCVSFNRVNTFAWYADRVYKLEADYDPTDKEAALARAQEWGERIPIGVIYEIIQPTYEAQLPALQLGPLVKQKLVPETVAGLLAEFL